ncbi:YraN family protein [Desulfovibrio sp. OttesenSCG-928-F07]|nr:YraN family protein [Desulfovibrio sp. OttesenSCG-928-F07]
MQNAKPNHLQTGETGEQMAVNFITASGMRIITRNWRPAFSGALAGKLELDIVAEEADTLVFVEVKTRKIQTGSAFTPEQAFTANKRQKLLRAVQFYLTEHNGWQRPCRLDLVCIEIYPDNTSKLEHYKNVLSVSKELTGRRATGGGNTAWQPW